MHTEPGVLWRGSSVPTIILHIRCEMPDGCFLHLFQVTSQSSFENLSGNIEVELVDGYELWELIFIFLGNFRSMYPVPILLPQGMLFKGKLGHHCFAQIPSGFHLHSN